MSVGRNSGPLVGDGDGDGDGDGTYVLRLGTHRSS